MIKIKKEKLLIKPEDLKPSSKYFEVIGTFNPGAMRLPNGDIVLYVRVVERLKKIQDEKYFYSPRMIGKNNFKIKIDKFDREIVCGDSENDFLFKDGTKRLTYISHLRRVILDETGFNIKSIDKKPSFYGISEDGELGIEDPRITKINNNYVMTYVSLSCSSNISTSYAFSKDCIHWHRRGIVFGEQDKDVVIFPEKIKNKYVAFDRPEGNFEFSPPHIWVAYSKNLDFWGKLKPFPFSKKGYWDYDRVGSGPPPIKTKKGWLLFYHGVLYTKKKEPFAEKFKDFFLSLLGVEEEIPDTIYSVGAALFDLKNPEKLIFKTNHPIILPKKKYEKADFGDMRVVFPTGLIFDENKKDILLFSGAGDKFVTIKKFSLEDVFDKLEKV